jgi:predicted ATPase
MPIKSIRLQNFKGFKNVKLDLKPLTVLLGPNSSGKSSFGQALVALSKNNLSRDRALSLSLAGPSINFGKYSDLIHEGCKGEHVIIEVETNSGALTLGFGGRISDNPLTKIGELDLTYIVVAEVAESIPSAITRASIVEDTKQIITTSLPNESDVVFKKATTLTRLNEKNWTIDGQVKGDYKIFFDGLDIEGVAHVTGTAVPPSDIFPVRPFQDAASLLEKVTYLRPDRVKPEREYRNEPYSKIEEINDFGDGAAWYVQQYGDTLDVDTFVFPRPTSNAAEAQKVISDVEQRKKETKKLREAVSSWLYRLGLAASFETKIVEGGRAFEVLVTPPNQTASRPLIDVGFGVSQVLPILVKGLCVKETGLFVVEQPEAQLHPKPQAELADFFCSMVKCGRNVLVETHSEALFHKLRLLAGMDKDLIDKIAIYFIDEPSVDTDGILRCSQPRNISLTPGDEFKWPTGFLYDGVETEMQVRATRIAKERKEDKH